MVFVGRLVEFGKIFFGFWVVVKLFKFCVCDIRWLVCVCVRLYENVFDVCVWDGICDSEVVICWVVRLLSVVIEFCSVVKVCGVVLVGKFCVGVMDNEG